MYVLALKAQPRRSPAEEDVELFVAEPEGRNFTDAKVTRHPHGGRWRSWSHRDQNHHCHSRYRLAPATTCLARLEDLVWSCGRKPPGNVRCRCMGTPKVEHETRFYITSLVGSAQLLGPIVRRHWAVENSLHWVLDMTFRDDECRVRTQHAPANFITVKHMAHNLIRRARGKDSLRLRRKVAAWGDDFLASLLFS